MTQRIEKINLKWDSHGRIKYTLSGELLARNLELWTIAPSAPAFFIGQLGALRPFCGLKMCKNIIDIVMEQKEIIAPINKNLKNARLEFVYEAGKERTFMYFPDYAFIWTDSYIEEGTCQLVSNYFSLVYNQMSKYSKLVTQAVTYVALDGYFGLIDLLINNSTVRVGKNIWSPQQAKLAVMYNKELMEGYIAPDEWRDNPKINAQEIKNWESSIIERIDSFIPRVKESCLSLCSTLRI
jgi:hypothetical protein